MPISRNLLLCTYCQSLFQDARQLRCGHSFCYHCILSQYDSMMNRITCFRCKRIHQFESKSHFQMTLIVDAFVMSVVNEHQRKVRSQSRPLLAFTNEQIFKRTPTPFLIAKCAECTLRKELVVCPECEQVICFECISQHQLIVNKDIRENWINCENTWNSLSEKSLKFDEQQIDIQSYARKLISHIEKRSNYLVQMIQKWEKIYENKLNQYAEAYKYIYHDIAKHYQMIDGNLQQFLNSNIRNRLKFEHLLNEINLFEVELSQRNKIFKQYHNKHPHYSCTDLDISFFGMISIDSTKTNLENVNYDDNCIIEHDSDDTIDDESTNADDQHPVARDDVNEDQINQQCDTKLENIPRKKLLWSLNFKFVPQYIALYRKSILFASDRWGFVSTWSYVNARTKPKPKKSFVLFPQFRVGTWSRVYVESFSVYKPYICVFVKGSDDSFSNFIAFFTHTGQVQMKIEYEHRYTLRQLICDESSKGNCIWAVDRSLHCIYKHDLPRTHREIQSYLSTSKTVTRLNGRSCDVIRMAINENVLAVLDSRTQIVTLYDKTTQQEIGTYSAEFIATGVYKLWRVEIFPDNSFLLRFDDDERSGDRSQIISHIIVHVKQNESNKNYEVTSQIQAENVYGFAIGPDSEVIAGLRKPNCFEGLINCYV